MYRFYYQNPINSLGQRIELSESESRHAAYVLRLAIGDSLIIINNSGFEYIGTISKISTKRIEVTIKQKNQPEVELPFHLTLAFAITRGKKIELALQKAVELGVGEFIPIFTSRCVKTAVSENQFERWQSIVISAVKQCHRTKMMNIQKPCEFPELIKKVQKYDRTLLPTTTTHHLALPLISDTPCLKSAQNILLAIGPEGGFEDAEVNAAIEAGFTAVSMGKRILRAETAAIAGIVSILTAKNIL